MKKVSEALTQTQSETAVRQVLLESGRIQITESIKGTPENRPAPPPQQGQPSDSKQPSR
jgi:hypothetical protein